MSENIIKNFIGKYITLDTSKVRVYGLIESCDDNFLVIRRPPYYIEHYRETHCIVPIKDIKYIDVFRKNKIQEDKERFTKWLREKKSEEKEPNEIGVEVR